MNSHFSSRRLPSLCRALVMQSLYSPAVPYMEDAENEVILLCDLELATIVLREK